MVNLLIIVLFWYGSAIIAVSSSKLMLTDISIPFTICFSQFIISFSLTSLYILYFSKISLIQWVKRINFIYYQNLINTAISYIFGFLLTNLALYYRPAPFVETVKAAEALSSAFLAYFLLHEYISKVQTIAIFPIVIGVALTSICYDTEFDLFGILLVFASNLCFSFRGYFRKKIHFPSIINNDKNEINNNKKNIKDIENNKNNYDNNELNIKEKDNLINVIGNDLYLFSFITGIGTLISLPFSIYEIYNLNTNEITSNEILIISINGICYLLYNLTSFMVLSRTLFVTHATLNVFRRAIIVLVTALFFNIPMNTMKLLGILLSFTGVYVFLRYK